MPKEILCYHCNGDGCEHCDETGWLVVDDDADTSPEEQSELQSEDDGQTLVPGVTPKPKPEGEEKMNLMKIGYLVMGKEHTICVGRKPIGPALPHKGAANAVRNFLVSGYEDLKEAMNADEDLTIGYLVQGKDYTICLNRTPVGDAITGARAKGAADNVAAWLIDALEDLEDVITSGELDGADNGDEAEEQEGE